MSSLIGLFLGAGATYELGMPLVWDVTAEMKASLTLANLRQMNARWRAQGGGCCPDESSSPGESHPRALTEPDMKLSPHPAPTIQPRAARRVATGRTSSDPVARCHPASASTHALDVAAA